MRLFFSSCQEYFARRPSDKLRKSTHLLINTPEGSKYEAAKKWNLPAVTSRYAICYKTYISYS